MLKVSVIVMVNLIPEKKKRLSSDPSREYPMRKQIKYPSERPGAFVLEPLEAAGPCCINPHSYSHCAMPPQEPSVLLGHPYLTFW